MRTPVVAGNWKMNGSIESVEALVGSLRSGFVPGKAEVLVCPPYPFLSAVVEGLSVSGIHVGSQNVSEHKSGAYTGEVSVAMLQDLGCKYVIVGHSERRSLFGESDQVVAAKFEMVRGQGLTPILCLGESLSEREAGDTLKVVKRQLMAVVQLVGIEAFKEAVVAYEPVWAIGTGLTASPEQAQEVHAALRSMLSELDASVSRDVSILYGGSVKADNAKALFASPDIDGGLIGGASLDPEEFLAICRAAE